MATLPAMKLTKFLFLTLLLPACQPQETRGPVANDTPPAVPQASSPDPARPDSYIGLTLEAAQATATAAEIPNRVVQVDGEPRAVTMDFREDRLNFTVVRGIVTAVTKG